MNTTDNRKGKRCWYKICIEECVYCGHTKETRIRQYTEKPKDAQNRYDYRQYVCGHHFC